jgi:hypothetical protein
LGRFGISPRVSSDCVNRPYTLRREPLDGRNKDRQVTDYAIFGTHGHVYADGGGFPIQPSRNPL